MTIKVNTTNIVFNDNTTQTTVGASGSVVYRFYPSAVSGPGLIWSKPSTPYTTYGSLKYIKVMLYGGGGGGSASYSVNYPTNSFWESYGVPGGPGGYAMATIPAPALTPTVTITMGYGGAGGTVPAGSGSSGTTSSFGSYVSATGGSGGFTSPSAYGGTVGSAGLASPTPMLSGGTTSTGIMGAPGWGAVGYGIIGSYGSINGSDGLPGTGIGQAGGGGTTAPYPQAPSYTTPGHAGGTGTTGLVIIEEYY